MSWFPPKARPNDLCPCGSGIKTKRCCMQSDGTLQKMTCPPKLDQPLGARQ
ncbi:MAG: SEC-C domain-containing protein [Deltaproteobacteria bacterium]|nr:SEC-C domain-containing protein [Deltaproteobacteria bacterium]